ncbi:hypothetical protein B4U80_13270 [Leptotrombidium deliense]|uniref:DNA-directed RNA polymerase n=1 Tax=Leptotrombidium deliense TaxID=299467 RepID=A0A443S9F8_9ACAR|nr:hypothetical protein B4U80_13270 [Leptotrombidium deliense]
MIFHPFSPIGPCRKRMSCIRIVCNELCDKSLLSRWFSTVSSILQASDDEYDYLLKEYSFISFVVNADRKSYSIQINTKSYSKNFHVHIPLIIGTKLWLMCQELEPNTLISYNIYNSFMKTKDIGCPLCSIYNYEYLTCFYISGKLMHCPIFLYVDPSKLHVHRTTKKLTLVHQRKIVDIPEKLESIRDELFSWSDYFHNYAIILISWIHVKFLTEVGLLATKCKFNDKIITKKVKDIASSIIKGNVAEAVSKTTIFKTTEIGGQATETDLANSYNKDLAKSDTETRKGFFKSSSRYITTPTNVPIMLMYSAMHCVKLISGQVLTNTHQSLHKSSIGFVCTQHTVDNKNAGMHLELLPGVHIPTRYECLDVKEIINSLLDKSIALIQENNKLEYGRIEREGIDNIYLYGPTMEEYVIHSAQLPRLDILITEMLKENTFPFEFYFNRSKRVGIFRSSKTSPLSAKQLFTSTTREWLIEQYQYTHLSATVNNSTPLMGVVAHHGSLLNHTSTNKITAGLCGHRHTVGHAAKSLRNLERSLCYPQNDLSRRNSLPIATQLAFTALVCDAGDNVEDGITNLKSYSINLKSITCQSSSRLMFVEPYDTGLLESGARIIHLKSVHTTYISSNSEMNITFTFSENRKLIQGDKFSTIEGQKATVINLTRPEDMPFVMDPRIPAIDVLMNVSATKRHTYGMFVSSLIRAAKCAKPEKFDLTLLMGDESIGHHTNDRIAQMLKDAEFMMQKTICDGRTGEIMGEADIFLCSFIKYNQEPVRVAYYAPDGEYVQRSIHGDVFNKGRNRIGATKSSQFDKVMMINQGTNLDIGRQYQICSEPRLVHDRNTGRVSQTAASSIKTLAVHGIEMIPKKRRKLNDF